MRARDSGSDGGGERVDAPREESRLQVEGWVICDDLRCLGCRVESRAGRVLNSKWSSPARDARKAYSKERKGQHEPFECLRRRADARWLATIEP